MLNNLHAPIWWGALLTVAGLGYTIGFRPRQSVGTRLTSEGNRQWRKDDVLGVIVGNRGFFPDHLAKTGREEMLRVLERPASAPSSSDPGADRRFGAVETPTEARLCADLFRKHRDEIDGVIVTLPNFGEERGIVDALRLSTLKVPVLVQATPDRAADMKISHRRDSFCGKMSACNNMMQYGIPYSLTAQHTVQPDSDEFRKDLAWFSSVCRVVRGFTNLRVGAIGARPAAFNTVRYSEKLLERSGISVDTLDLSEVLGRIERLKDNDDAVQTQAGGHPEVCVHQQYSRSPL